MLYAVRYDSEFPRRGEEGACQRELAQRLLAWSLKQEYGTALEDLTIAYGPHGKPYFENHPARYNLSHCKGLVCCALSNGEIGVDAETVRPYSRHLAERIGTPLERAWLDRAEDRDAALTSLWTLKESLMKLTGEGFRYGFQNAAFSFSGEGPVSLIPGVRVCQYRKEGWILSVCCREEPPERLQFVELEKLS